MLNEELKSAPDCNEQEAPEPAIKDALLIDNVQAAEAVWGSQTAKKPKSAKEKIALCCCVILVAVLVIAVAVLHKPKFEQVREECAKITDTVSGDNASFSLDTYPDSYENMDEATVAPLLSAALENTLTAIKYANEALGFDGSVYSKMLGTTSIMGRQREENRKYAVTWTYHPDEGLEVTYEKK